MFRRSLLLPAFAALAMSACYVGPGDDDDATSFHADPSSIDFGYIAPADFSEFISVELINNTGSTVSIEVIRMSEDSDAAFSLGAVPATLPASVSSGSSETITVAFAPPVSGEFLGAIEVLTDSSTYDQILVNLGGCSTGEDCTVDVGDDDDAADDDDVANDDDAADDDDDDGAGDGDIDVNETAVEFGDVPQNQNPPGDVVQVSNVGNGPLVISSVEVSGTDASLFVVGGFAGGTLPAGGAPANLNISFNAAGASVGAKTASLVISSDDPDEGTVTLPMSANVTQPCLDGPVLEIVGGTLTPNPLGSPPNLVYKLLTTNSTTDIVVTNSGCDVLNVTSIADDSGTIVGPNADITISGQDALPWALGGGDEATVTFTVGATGGCDVVNVNGAYGFTVGTEADITACLLGGGGLPF
ncbi:MAG: choice-of-anchor D domain-containing protein [Deltaproteobacteria bacterium]|nr:choice-of-anchor D domain-containing protein [Deltaproteobacteria bacterium]